MGLLGFLKKENRSVDLLPEEKRLLQRVSKINSSGRDITPELYQQLRDFEVAWLERHYDFNSLDGINAIPENKNVPGVPGPSGSVRGHTGEVYYYLRRKAYEHEDSGNMDLALACMRKSVALVKLRPYYSADDCYPLVKMLARAGYVEDAYKEKAITDACLTNLRADINQSVAKKSVRNAKSLGTDLVIMDAQGSTCPECAKYQGRVYSISGRSRKFPKVPDFYFTSGTVHKGCSHMFWPYIDGVNDPDLKHTLSVHPLQNKAYGKDIVTFSNRPFADDRTDACKKKAAAAIAELEQRSSRQNNYDDNMIEIEALRGQETRDYLWLQENLPDKCPKSLSGFRRMKTQNTKNYQALKQMASNMGRNI